MKNLYKHYKGKTYNLILHCLHTETKEHLVVYQDTYSGVIHARPAESFYGKTKEGEKRFTLIEGEETDPTYYVLEINTRYNKIMNWDTCINKTEAEKIKESKSLKPNTVYHSIPANTWNNYSLTEIENYLSTLK